ncbi:MAG: PAS domain S-box protein [Desulfosudaceae bacterium]
MHSSNDQKKARKDNTGNGVTMKVNPFTLRFTNSFADYEARFQRHYLIKSLKPLRFAILMGVLVWGSFGVLDIAIAREEVSLLWTLRYGIVIPIMMLGLVVSYQPLFEKMMQPFISLAILITGASVIIMITVSETPMKHTYYAGLILIFMFAYTILRMRFIWATITCWMLVLAYEIAAAYFIDTPRDILLSNSFFFIGANLLGMTACYFIELSSRRDFFLATQLSNEKTKVAQANQELEKNIRERTKQLIKINEDLNLTIAGQQKAQEKLRRSEEKYRTIITTIEEGYYEIDLNGNFTFINESMVRIFDCQSKDDLLDTNYRDYVDDSRISDILWAFNEIYQSNISVTDMNWEITRKDGSIRYLEVSANRISDSAGEPTGFRGIVRDITERKKMEQELVESYENIKQTRTMIILGLAKLAEYRDRNTGEHLERIMEYTRILTKALRQKPKYRDYITDEYIEDVYISSMLHDIGKVGISDDILLKPAALTEEEYEKVKEHTILGGNALSAVEVKVKGKSFLSIGKQICYHHHEKWNGLGYPSGLEGDDIPLSARIVALTDVYDTVTSDRVYKDAASHETAVDIIKNERGEHFDPEIVDTFLTVEDQFKSILDNRCVN